ncbi:hypothetical protein NL676_032815 [Syzygium grande]|nr:hypothetical protein NL676_032815 [Syzygium grande]
MRATDSLAIVFVVLLPPMETEDRQSEELLASWCVELIKDSEGEIVEEDRRGFEKLIAALDTVVEGLAALWPGLGPNIAWNAFINVAELASYDQVKQVKSRMIGDSTYISTLDCFIKTLKYEAKRFFVRAAREKSCSFTDGVSRRVQHPGALLTMYHRRLAIEEAVYSTGKSRVPISRCSIAFINFTNKN